MKRTFCAIVIAVWAFQAFGGGPRIVYPARPPATQARMTATGDPAPEWLVGWHSGVVERCAMAGIAAPTWSETFLVPAGESNQVVTVACPTGGVYVLTNRLPLVEYFTVTNRLAGTFAYTVTNDNGETITGTGAFPMTGELWDALERKTEDLIPYFVSLRATNDSGNLGSWLDKNWNGYYATIPWESKAGLFAREGIGLTYAPNMTTNAFGWITGGTGAAFWKAIDPESGQAQEIILGEAVADHVFALSGFPDDRANGRYFWKPSYGWDGYYWYGGGWFNVDREPLYSYYDSPALYYAGGNGVGWAVNLWEYVDHSGQTYHYRLDGKRLPVSTNGWKTAAGSNLVGAVSAIATNWVYRPVEGQTLVPGAGIQGDWIGNGYLGRKVVKGPALVHYTRAPSNALESLTVIVQGYAATNGLTNLFVHYDLTSGDAGEIAETVSVSSAWTPLANPWLWVTNLIVTGPAKWGDAVQVVHTNMVMTGQGGIRVMEKMIAERTNALSKLKWTAAYLNQFPWDGLLGSSGLFWSTNEYGEGTGYSGPTNDPAYWTEAKAAAITAWATGSGLIYPNNGPSSAGLSARTLYPPAANYGYARIFKNRAGLYVTNLTDAIPKTADLYLRFRGQVNDSGATNYYNPDFPGLAETQAVVAYSWPAGTDTVLESPIWGTTNTPAADDPYWITPPDTNGVYRKGYTWENLQIVILKWAPSYP